jgi:hypothetical protein
MATRPEELCCPRFDPEPWDEREITWEGKTFVTDHVRCILHIPLNFGPVMQRNVQAIEAAGVKPDRMIILAQDQSLWRTKVLLEVTGELPGSTLTTISGTFQSKVFDGPYSQMRSWMQEMGAYVAGLGKEIKQLYTFYTTCPRCAKEHGQNPVVLLAEV